MKYVLIYLSTLIFSVLVWHLILTGRGKNDLEKSVPMDDWEDREIKIMADIAKRR